MLRLNLEEQQEFICKIKGTWYIVYMYETFKEEIEIKRKKELKKEFIVENGL